MQFTINFTLTFGWGMLMLGLIGFLYTPALFVYDFFRAKAITLAPVSGHPPTREEIVWLFGFQERLSHPTILILVAIRRTIIGLVLGFVIDNVISAFW